jgi:hypothetical protein
MTKSGMTKTGSSKSAVSYTATMHGGRAEAQAGGNSRHRGQCDHHLTYHDACSIVASCAPAD